MNTYSNFDIKKHLSPLKELTSSIKTKEVLLRSASAYNYKTINSEINFDLNKNIINNNKKKCNNYTLYLHDISCTLAINLKEISNIKKTDTITKKEMEIIRYKISYITNLFKNLRKSQKTKKYLNSKILVNNQLLEEIKRKKFEDFQMKKEKKNDLMRGVQKKENTIKKLRAKFKEVEIFVRRESQSHQKYRALYRYFSIDNFLNKNTLLYTTIKTKKNEIKKRNELINIVKKENDEYKNRYISMVNKSKNNNKKIKIYNNKNNEREQNLNMDKESNILIILKDRNDISENYNKKLNKLYKNFYNDKLYINQFTYKVLNNLNKLNLNESYSSPFNSESNSTSNFQENEEEGQDSSELWSESDIEK